MMMVLALFLQTEPVKHPQAHDMGGGGGSEYSYVDLSVAPNQLTRKKMGGNNFLPINRHKKYPKWMCSPKKRTCSHLQWVLCNPLITGPMLILL